MSYKRKSYRLTWPEGHVRHGLIVSMRGMSIDDMELASSLKGIDAENAEDSKELLIRIADLLAAKMISWNLTDDDDNAVPITAAQIRKEDMTMVMEILNSWTEAAVGVKASLGKGSNSGNSFPEESIPMETLSPSPESSNTQN